MIARDGSPPAMRDGAEQMLGVRLKCAPRCRGRRPPRRIAVEVERVEQALRHPLDTCSCRQPSLAPAPGSAPATGNRSVERAAAHRDPVPAVVVEEAFDPARRSWAGLDFPPPLSHGPLDHVSGAVADDGTQGGLVDGGATPMRSSTWLVAATRSGAVSTSVPSRSKTRVRLPHGCSACVAPQASGWRSRCH